MNTAEMILGFVVAGIAIGGVIVGFLKWQASRERKLLFAEVRDEIRTTVNGEIKTVQGQNDAMDAKLDTIRDEANHRWTETQARLAEGSQQFAELHRKTSAEGRRTSRLETRLDAIVDARRT